MIYTASDIIRKAEMAADLQNSDFISWYEKMSLLNDSFVTLYQKLINTSDMSFVNRVLVDGDVMDLPCDFWQIKNVFISMGLGDIQEVLRRAPSASLETLSYEIIGNQIHIYGARYGDVYLEYYKKPCDLTFKPGISELNLYGKEILASYGDWAVTTDEMWGPESQVCIENLRTGSILQVPLQMKRLKSQNSSTESCYIVAGKNGWAIKQSSDLGDGFCHMYTWSGTELHSPYLKTDKDLLVKLPNDNIGILCGKSLAPNFGFIYEGTTRSKYSIPSTALDNIDNLQSNKYLLPIEDGSKVFFCSGHVNGDDYTNIICYSSNELSGIVNITLNESFVYSTDYTIKGNTIWSIFKGTLSKITLDDSLSEIVDYAEMGTDYVTTISDFNYNTGYGFIAKDTDGTFYRVPFVEDSTLDFPNTFYYQMLSILLAIQFCIKQGKDTMALAAQLQMYEQTFYDTLARDSHNFTRIGNVYN